MIGNYRPIGNQSSKLKGGLIIKAHRALSIEAGRPLEAVGV